MNKLETDRLRETICMKKQPKPREATHYHLCADTDIVPTSLITVAFGYTIRKRHPSPVGQQLNKNAYVLFLNQLTSAILKCLHHKHNFSAISWIEYRVRCLKRRNNIIFGPITSRVLTQPLIIMVKSKLVAYGSREIGIYFSAWYTQGG